MALAYDTMELGAARKRRLASLQVHVSGNALAVMTQAQRDALIRLTQDSAWTSVRVTTSFDLPDDWLLFVFDGGLVGGIDPEGSVNT